MYYIPVNFQLYSFFFHWYLKLKNVFFMSLFFLLVVNDQDVNCFIFDVNNFQLMMPFYYRLSYLCRKGISLVFACPVAVMPMCISFDIVLV